jgi:2-haloacid dehalogenase
LGRLQKPMLNFNSFTYLTFDCYGTLIDWETGILTAVRPILQRHGVSPDDAAVLGHYTRLEAELEAGPYRAYREVLQGVVDGLGEAYGFRPDAAEREALPASVGTWPPFPDSVAALQQLKSRFALVILSNIDDALFAETNRLLGVEFDAVITAQQVGSYKPCLTNFETALQRLVVPKAQVLHVAQSLYHDHVPAKALGLSTVWVNRPSRLPGTGLALPAEAAPDLTVPDLQSLVAAISPGG